MYQASKQRLEKVLLHRGMYEIETDLGRAISFVAGFDAANNGFILEGFREWFLEKFLNDYSEPFSWLFLVERELQKIGQDEKKKVDRFVEIIIEFLENTRTE